MKIINKTNQTIRIVHPDSCFAVKDTLQTNFYKPELIAEFPPAEKPLNFRSYTTNTSPVMTGNIPIRTRAQYFHNIDIPDYSEADYFIVTEEYANAALAFNLDRRRLLVPDMNVRISHTNELYGFLALKGYVDVP